MYIPQSIVRKIRTDNNVISIPAAYLKEWAEIYTPEQWDGQSILVENKPHGTITITPIIKKENETP